MRTLKLSILALALALTGCISASTQEFAGKVRDHVLPMKPVYDNGVATYPGATPDDQRVYREHWDQLMRLLDAGEGKP